MWDISSKKRPKFNQNFHQTDQIIINEIPVEFLQNTTTADSDLVLVLWPKKLRHWHRAHTPITRSATAMNLPFLLFYLRVVDPEQSYCRHLWSYHKRFSHTCMLSFLSFCYLLAFFFSHILIFIYPHSQQYQHVPLFTQASVHFIFDHLFHSLSCYLLCNFSSVHICQNVAIFKRFIFAYCVLLMPTYI